MASESRVLKQKALPASEQSSRGRKAPASEVAESDEARRGPNRAAEVLNALRDRISRHELAPGSHLREQELAEEYGVPRTLVREVFSGLEQRGLIQRFPNQGAVVSRFDSKQLFAIYDIREVLEALCVRLATQSVPPESWQDLVEFFDGPMATFVASGDIDAYLDGYAQLRQRIIQAADNAVLAEVMDNYWEKTRVHVSRIVIMPGRVQEGLAEHQAVLHAMRQGDAVSAEALRRESMRKAKAALVKFQKYVL